VDPSLGLGEATEDLALGEGGAGEEGGRGRNARPHEEPPPEPLAIADVLGVGEEGEVVDRRDAGKIQPEGASVGRAQEHLDPVATGRSRELALLEDDPAGGLSPQGTRGGRAGEGDLAPAVQVDEEGVPRGPGAEKTREISTCPRAASLELPAVDADDQRAPQLPRIFL
jgi:hypothetical protein